LTPDSSTVEETRNIKRGQRFPTRFPVRSAGIQLLKSGFFSRLKRRARSIRQKISENSGSKLNGTEIFRKFVSKISVHLSRLSFFPGIWKFRKFPVPFGISTQYESGPAPLVVKSYEMAANVSSHTTLDAK